MNDKPTGAQPFELKHHLAEIVQTQVGLLVELEKLRATVETFDQALDQMWERQSAMEASHTLKLKRMAMRLARVVAVRSRRARGRADGDARIATPPGVVDHSRDDEPQPEPRRRRGKAPGPSPHA